MIKNCLSGVTTTQLLTLVRGPPPKNSRSDRANNFLSKNPKMSGIGLGSSELECAPRAWCTRGGSGKLTHQINSELGEATHVTLVEY